jgi:hypothetical protein
MKPLAVAAVIAKLERSQEPVTSVEVMWVIVPPVRLPAL